ncbi:23925_t:CDS:2 [Racocetra persica]|uniref:23925_t:CDS:1 n=1 Tax=Racocetra persica TaxID=160502 RepID=A0ACA9N1L3_9GLOM|nr:23925_t:CDS:2 [Racocetra persica]
MDNVIDLKKELYIALQDSSEIVSYNAKLQDSCKEVSSPLYADCIVIRSFIVVGMRFCGGHKFKKSDIITLEPELSNMHVINAIKVIVDGIYKAYVAKNKNENIGDLMK